LEVVSDRLFVLYAHLVTLPAIVVAAVDGVAVGGGGAAAAGR
jgi:enoyl-CoA hydratase/carnithine racemase